MDELSERLRDLADHTQGNLTVPAMREAADALDALQAEVAEKERLRAMIADRELDERYKRQAAEAEVEAMKQAYIARTTERDRYMTESEDRLAQIEALRGVLAEIAEHGGADTGNPSTIVYNAIGHLKCRQLARAALAPSPSEQG